MVTAYKQKYIVIMEDGQIIKVTIKAQNSAHGEGLAIAYATEKNGGQVWDIANCPCF